MESWLLAKPPYYIVIHFLLLQLEIKYYRTLCNNFFCSEMLPKLTECQSDASGLINLFAHSSPQLNFLYVNYCIGRHRSEEICRDNGDYLEVSYNTFHGITVVPDGAKTVNSNNLRTKT